MSTCEGKGAHKKISTHLGRGPAMADEPVLMGLAELPDVAVFVVGIRVGEGYEAMSDPGLHLQETRGSTTYP